MSQRDENDRLRDGDLPPWVDDELEDIHVHDTTPDGRPYIVVPPGGGTTGWFIATSNGGFGLVREKLVHVELSRHWPDLEVTSQVGDGPPKALSGSELFRRYGVRAENVYYTYFGETRFRYRAGHTGDVVVRVISPEPVPAVEHADVLEWFGVVLGERTDVMLDWLATVGRLDRPTGVPVLIGRDSLGKSMLPLGVARYFGESITDYDDVFKERFNDALLRSPLVWLDETTEVDARSGRFRKLAANDRHSIEAKGAPSGTLLGCPRLMVTSNDPDPLRLGREELNQASENAIGLRIIQIDCCDAAAAWLEERGGREFTHDWVQRPDGRPGKIPEVIAWLAEHRDVQPGTRLLVGGNSAEWAARIGTRVGLAATILDAIRSYLALAPGDRNELAGYPFRWDARFPDHVLVGNQDLRSAWSKLMGERAPTHKAVAAALKKLAPGGNDKHTLSDGTRVPGYLVPKALYQDSDEEEDV